MNIYKNITFFENYNYSDDIYPHEFLWNKKIDKLSIYKNWENHIKNKKKGGKLMLQINIPFCETRCFYCTHKVKITTKNSIDKYINNLEKEIKLYSGIFKNKKINYLYIGGGTPSILSSFQLERLYKIIFANFQFDFGEKNLGNMIEFSPNTVSEEKIKIIKKYNVGKVTFGIQDIDEDLMKKNNRLQSINNINSLVDLLDKYKIPFVNVDIMAGLQYQTYQNFKKTLDFVINLSISSICLNIYKKTNIVLNKNTGIFNKKYFEERKKMIEYWRTTYSHRDDIILKKEIKEEQLYNFDNEKLSILGIGYGVNSHIYGKSYYKINSLEVYNKGKFGYIGIDISIKDEIVRYIIVNLKENGVSIENIKNIFGDYYLDFFIQKFKFLYKKGLLYTFEKEGRTYYRFKFTSDLLYNIYIKIFYSSKYIEFYKEYFLKYNSFKNMNIDLELKKYFIN